MEQESMGLARPQACSRPTSRGPRRRTVLHWCALLVAAALLAFGCERSMAASGLVEVHERLYALKWASADAYNAEASRPEIDPRDLSFARVHDGAGVEFLGVSELLGEVGVLEFLDDYIFDIPSTAAFLARLELTAAQRATAVLHPNDDAASVATREFEDRILNAANGVLVDGLPPSIDPHKLHDAFFDALDQCCRASPWPAAELYVGGDPEPGEYPSRLVKRDFGMSYFEYMELLHECGKFAATYPTLDEAVRDQLLAAQRAHYAQAVLAGLDEAPAVEIPAKYRGEIDELRRTERLGGVVQNVFGGGV